MNKKTIAIIGGGAAGFFAGINIARNNPNYKVFILEKTVKTLQKVKVSGGGRCNITHHCFDNTQLSKNYPRGEEELLQAFTQFNVKDTISWFAHYGIKLKSESDGRIFPVSNTSQTIIDCFETTFKELNGKVHLNTEVVSLRKVDSIFEISLKNEKTVKADCVIVTCGGANNTGAYDFLKDFNIKLRLPIASLFTFNLKDKSITQLMGLSVANAQVQIKHSNYSQKGVVLVTHWGFSGPCVLKLSAFAAEFLHQNNYQFEIEINWASYFSTQTLFNKILELKNSGTKTWNYITAEVQLPKRLVAYFLTQIAIEPSKKLAETSNKKIEQFCQLVCSSTFEIKGKTTFKEEFVTCGGVDLKEVDIRTMQSKKIKGLYFAGEVLNIDGITGGFNFQAAWTTAYIAAMLKN